MVSVWGGNKVNSFNAKTPGRKVARENQKQENQNKGLKP